MVIWQLLQAHHTLMILVCFFINRRAVKIKMFACDFGRWTYFLSKLHMSNTSPGALGAILVRCNGSCRPFAKCQQISQALFPVVTFSQLIRRSRPVSCQLGVRIPMATCWLIAVYKLSYYLKKKKKGSFRAVFLLETVPFMGQLWGETDVRKGFSLPSLVSTGVLIHLPGLVYLPDEVMVHVCVYSMRSSFILQPGSCEVPVELAISI